jgi:hypothetical protein
MWCRDQRTPPLLNDVTQTTTDGTDLKVRDHERPEEQQLHCFQQTEAGAHRQRHRHAEEKPRHRRNAGPPRVKVVVH